MLLSDALGAPTEATVYLERYVNRGSPSGFTPLNTTSEWTSHRGTGGSFFLDAIVPHPRIQIVEFGSSPQAPTRGVVLAHPDVSDDCYAALGGEVLRNFIEVTPTASDRTVQEAGAPHTYFKLSYPRLIGRTNRRLALEQAEAAVWVTEAIDRAFPHLDQRFRFLREGFSRVAIPPTGSPSDQWGFTVRDPIPAPRNEDIALMIPGFSLFSPDRNHPNDDPLLVQLFRAQSKSPDGFVYDGLIEPLLDCYFSLLLATGLQMEAHAQNVLLGVDSDAQLRAVIIRDAESIDRDISLMDDLNLQCSRPSGKYKIIKRGDYNYQIIHSFMFDFKFGEYLLSPIVDSAHKYIGSNPENISVQIKERSRYWIAQLPTDFFPADGNWYSYDNIVHDRSQERPYVAKPNPRFR